MSYLRKLCKAFTQGKTQGAAIGLHLCSFISARQENAKKKLNCKLEKFCYCYFLIELQKGNALDEYLLVVKNITSTLYKNIAQTLRHYTNKLA